MSTNKTPNRKGNTSPAKQRTLKESQAQPDVNTSDYVNANKELLVGLTEGQVEIDHLKTIVVALNEKVVVIEDLKTDVNTHKDLLRHSEGKRGELQVHIVQTSEQIKVDTQQHTNYEQSLIEETQKLQNEIQALKAYQAQREREHLQKLEEVNQKHSNRVDQMSKEHSDKVNALNDDHHKKVDQLEKAHHQQVTQLNHEKEQLRQEKDAHIRALTEEKEAQRVSYERKINELDQLIKQQQRTILQLNSHILELKEILAKKVDVEDQLAKALEQLAIIDAQKVQLQKELETASDYILELEEKVYKANKTSLELLRQLKDAEVEIETLKNYIIELKQRIAVYIPVKDDVIDKKLAEFINNYPERQKLKIMFMRESDGVYQFGSKRVSVRVDKDKINIRVGGGYLSIDEFLDQYTPAELEKIERKDPLKKFSEKIAIQKTIVGKEARESSPVRSPERTSSPRRQ